ASASMQVGNTSDTLVASTNTSKGAGSALTDEDMQPLYSDNLEQDLAPFAQQRKQYAMPEIVRTAAGLRIPSSLGEFLFVVVIKKGKMHGAPILDDPSSLARQRMDALITASAEASRQGTPLPDTVFLLNLHEQPRCPYRVLHSSLALSSPPNPPPLPPDPPYPTPPPTPPAPSLTNRSPGNASRLRSPCLAPVLSMFKTWSARNTSQHADLLLPAFDHSHTVMSSTPWQLKTPKGFMRAAIHRSMSLNCTRLRLHDLALSKEGRRWLDVGITASSNPRLRLNLSQPIHLAEWTLWKYLVHTDSITASSTLATLLSSNSLVLKQRSPYIEYYYRSLQPGRLFHEFAADTSDILKVIEGLEAADRAGDPSLQAMIQASNAFHHRFLTTAAKLLYLRQLLRRYNQLLQPNLLRIVLGRLHEGRLRRNDTDHVMTVLWHSLKGHAAQPMLGPWYAWQGVRGSRRGEAFKFGGSQ
ncbi:hypothetical protein QJQ45_026521, partial [Haematococcus lacustris]